MNEISRQLVATVIAVALFAPVIVQAGSRSHGPLNEEAARNLLRQAIKRDNVYAKRISLACVTFETEDTTRIYFEFVLRENHNAKCGGDPDLSPAIDRYRVNRASGKIEWLDRVAGNWQPYNPAKIR